MSGQEIQGIRDDLAEIKRSLGELTRVVADLRVQVAGNYVTKAEYTDHLKTDEARVIALHDKIEDHEKSERSERWKIFGAAMTVAALVVGVIQWVVSLLNKVKG